MAFLATSSVSKNARNGSPRPGGVLMLGFSAAGVVAVPMKKALPPSHTLGGLYRGNYIKPELSLEEICCRVNGVVPKRQPKRKEAWWFLSRQLALRRWQGFPARCR